MSILQNSQKKMFSNENSETAIFCEISLRIRWYFSQISVIKIELSTGETDINLDKKVIQRWFFAISWIECMLNDPIYDNSNMSPKHCKIFRQIAQIDDLWCGYEQNEAKFICSESNTAWNLLIFIVWRLISNIFVVFYPEQVLASLPYLLTKLTQQTSQVHWAN